MAAPRVPDPLEVVLLTDDGPQFWDVVASLGPLAILIAALMAAFIAWRSMFHQSEADRRAQWWTRTAWALDAATSADQDRRVIGLGVLTLLAESKLAGEEEAKIIRVASIDSLADNHDVMDDPETSRDNGRADTGSEAEL